MSNCYCVCHSPNSSGFNCEHCANKYRQTPDTQELEVIVRREVVKAQHGTVGELTDAIVEAIEQNYIFKSKVREAIPKIKLKISFNERQLEDLKPGQEIEITLTDEALDQIKSALGLEEEK